MAITWDVTDGLKKNAGVAHREINPDDE